MILPLWSWTLWYLGVGLGWLAWLVRDDPRGMLQPRFLLGSAIAVLLWPMDMYFYWRTR